MPVALLHKGCWYIAGGRGEGGGVGEIFKSRESVVVVYVFTLASFVCSVKPNDC